MDTVEIPLIKHLGIIRNSNGLLELPYHKNIGSYFETQHAGTQFTLAETASVDYLIKIFTELNEQAMPVLRGSEVKFRKMSKNSIVAIPSISDEMKNSFLTNFEKKSRSNITIEVKLIDSDDIVTFTGKFHWFVSTINPFKGKN